MMLNSSKFMFNFDYIPLQMQGIYSSFNSHGRDSVSRKYRFCNERTESKYAENVSLLSR